MYISYIMQYWIKNKVENSTYSRTRFMQKKLFFERLGRMMVGFAQRDRSGGVAMEQDQGSGLTPTVHGSSPFSHVAEHILICAPTHI